MVRTIAHIMVSLCILAGGASAQQPALNAQEEPIAVTVSRQGKIFLQAREISLSELQRELWALTQSRKGLEEPIFLRADKAVNYGDFRQVMGRIAAAGYKHILLVKEFEGEPLQPPKHQSPAQAPSAINNAQAQPITVTVSRQGKIFLQASEISTDDLQPKLWAIAQTRKGLEEPIFVGADGAVNYGALMQVTGRIASAGYKHISLLTAIGDEPKQPARHASSVQAPDATSAASCAEAVGSRIEQNWNPPFGMRSGENTIIRLHIELRRDGMLSRVPAVLDQLESPVHQAMADAAVRAAIQGQPFMIPPQQYEQCRDMILRFDPGQMYGR